MISGFICVKIDEWESFKNEYESQCSLDYIGKTKNGNAIIATIICYDPELYAKIKSDSKVVSSEDSKKVYAQ